MRQQILFCDKCGQKYSKKDMVLVNYTISRFGATSEKSTLDLCRECYEEYEKVYNDFLNGVEISPKKEEVKEEPVVPQETPKEQSELPRDYEKGMLSNFRVKQLVRMLIDGATVENIAKEICRDVNFTKRTIYRLEKKHGTLTKDNEWVQNFLGKAKADPLDGLPDGFEYKIGPMTEEERDYIVQAVAYGVPLIEIIKKSQRMVRSINRITNEWSKNFGDLTIENYEKVKSDGKTLSECRREEKNNKDKKIDIGGIMALYKAGWSPMSIAYDMEIEEHIVEKVIKDERSKGQ